MTVVMADPRQATRDDYLSTGEEGASYEPWHHARETTPLLQRSSSSVHATPRLAGISSGTSSVVGLPSPTASSSRKARALTYVLVCIFGMASWVTINAIMAELPLFVQVAPEKWTLPSYVYVIAQLANIGPLAYLVALKLLPNHLNEWRGVYILIAVGAVTSILLAVFWRRTTYVAGAEHSTALFILTACMAMADCASSVVFLPYMAMYKPQYLTALYVGEGLSGLVPGLAGLIQGGGTNTRCINGTVITNGTSTTDNATDGLVLSAAYQAPRFSVEVFFYFIFAVLCLSGISFSLLHFLPVCKRERVPPPLEVPSSVERDKMAAQDDIFCCKPGESRSDGRDGFSSSISGVSSEDSSNCQFVLLLLSVGLIGSLANGVVPSVLSFSALPYGDITYDLSVRLSSIINPVACVLALFVATSSVACVWLLTAFGGALATYQIYLAVMSPNPPMKDSVLGQALVISAAVLMTAVFAYTKLSISMILNRAGGRRALLWCGGVLQVGSFIGAVVAFTVVNVLQLLVSEPPC